MSEDTLLPFAFPPVQRKKVVAAFDGGRLTSDGGLMLLAAAERRLGIVDKLAVLIADPRDPALVTHSLADILRARILAIACGYEDGNDLDHLRGALVHFDGVNDGRMLFPFFGPNRTDAAQTQRRPPSPHPEDVVQGAELAGVRSGAASAWQPDFVDRGRSVGRLAEHGAGRAGWLAIRTRLFRPA